MSIGQMIESSGHRESLRQRDDAVQLLERGDDGVSVVIPCFEQAQYLGDSLGSVLKQTVPPLEVLVIDDGTPDPYAVPPAVETARGSSEIPVRVIRVANRGLPSARNVGLMNARGKAFLPLDADDWIEPTYLERALPLLEEADVVCVGLQEHGQRNGRYQPGCELGMGRLTIEEERLSNRLFYCSLFRTELLRTCGGYNGRMIHGYEDWDLWIDLMQRGARFAVINDVLFNYRTRPDSMLAQTEAEWRDWNFDEMARHHGYVRPQKRIRGAPQVSRAVARREQQLALRAARRQK